MFVRRLYVFREIYSFPNAKLEENCEPRGAYDDGSIFSRQMEAIELSLNYFATSRGKNYKHVTISLVFQCSKVRLNEYAHVHLL